MIKNKNCIETILNSSKLIKKLNVNGGNFNSEAYLYKLRSNYYVVRKIGNQYNLSAKRLAVLEKDVNNYYKILKKHLPNNLPNIFLTKIDKKQKVILLATEYFSKKIIDIKNISQKFKYFKVISKLIIKLVSSRSNLYLNNLICSIDPSPDNFFLDSKNKLIYNDFTPPLFRKDGKWSEFRRLDEINAKKSDKEKRYFIGLNLLLIFINKARIYLSFSDYLKFVRWLFNKINRLHLLQQNSLVVFFKIYKEILSDKVLDFHKLKQYATLRDILRFTLTFRKDLNSFQIKKIYERSKKIDGIDILIKKLYGKNKNSYNRSR